MQDCFCLYRNEFMYMGQSEIWANHDKVNILTFNILIYDHIHVIYFGHVHDAIYFEQFVK